MSTVTDKAYEQENSVKKCNALNNELVFLLGPQDRLVNEVRIELTVKFLEVFFSVRG